MYQSVVQPLELPNDSMLTEEQLEQHLSVNELAMIAGGMVVVNTI